MEKQSMTEDLKANVQDGNVWMRLLFMALFAVLYWITEAVLAVVIVFQFLSLLLSGQKNTKVLAFGSQLSSYVYQIFSFLTFNTDEKPFPMGDWPSDKTLTAQTGSVKGKPAPRKTTSKKTTTKKTPAKQEEPKAEKKGDDKPSASDSITPE